MSTSAGGARVYRACTLCEAACGLVFEVEGERIVGVRGDGDDPFSRGFCCPKGVASGELHHDPDRLRKPLVRRGGALVEVGWAEAISAAADGLAGVIREHGPDAVAAYVGNPVVHRLGAMVGTELWRHLLPSRNRYSANSQDANPHLLANFLMFGAQLSHPVADVDRTELLLILGANPLASNGSLMTAPRFGARMKAIQSRGGKVVVIDPRRTETARLADEHLFVRPGTDAFLLLSLARQLRDRWDRAFLERWTEGAEKLARLLEPFAPERVAPRLGAGWSAEVIERLAEQLGAAGSAAVYGRLGLCTGPFAGLTAWALNVINLVSGNLDKPGGMMFPEGPNSWAFGERLARGSYDRYRSPQGSPEFGGEYPCHILADQMRRGRETPGSPEAVHALVTFSGNPASSIPGGPRLREAITGLRFRVAFDIYLSETAQLADVVLPPRSSLHEPHYEALFSHLSVEDIGRYSPAVLPPPADQPGELELIVSLAREVVRRTPGPRSLRGRLKRKALAALAPTLTAERVAALAVRYGSRGRGANPLSSGLTAQRLASYTHGLPPVPLSPRLKSRVHRPGGRIDLVPAPCVRDLPRLVATLDADAPSGLTLIGRRHLRSNNSWFHNLPSSLTGGNRCTLRMHPDDATERGLEDGERVELRSRAGRLHVLLELSDEVAPGVVSLPHGWGHGEHGGAVAAGSEGVNVNVVVDEDACDPLSGNSVLNGVPVEVVSVAARVEA